jgi:hypothetical protein
MTRIVKLQDDDWRHVATVELVDESNALRHLIVDKQSRYKIERSTRSPAGFSWFDIHVDFGVGGRQAAHAAYAVLAAMQKAADRGALHGYRIVSGQHWLELAEILGHDSGAS